MESKLDLTRKEDWTPARASEIAMQFGYVLNDNFLHALQSYIIKSVADAKVTQYLGIFAGNHFKSWQPPLEKLPQTFSSLPTGSR